MQVVYKIAHINDTRTYCRHETLLLIGALWAGNVTLHPAVQFTWAHDPYLKAGHSDMPGIRQL
jgi:hypothetical protein